MTEDPREAASRALIPFEPQAVLARRGMELLREIDEQRKKIRILVVDDLPSMRYLFAKLLGFEEDMEVVELASDGREGIIRSRDELPDVVLMDVNMPVMDGITATEYITNTTPGPRVIITSIRDSDDYKTQALAAGADTYLQIPVSSEVLVAAVRDVAARGTRKSRPPTRQTEFEVSGETAEMAPRSPLLVDISELPPGFLLWHDSGPRDDYPPDGSTYRYRVFVHGDRPATTSPVIWSQLWSTTDDAAAAGKYFARLKLEDAWSGRDLRQTVSDLARWPQAGIFTETREIPFRRGTLSRAYTAVLFGRITVWVYGYSGTVVQGLRTQDVEPDLVLTLADTQFLKRV